jgi:hypothetical protein
MGYYAKVDGSNKVLVGNTAVTTIGGYTGWTTYPSDSRFKKNVKENVPGLAFITKLKPVTYTIDIDAIDARLQPKGQNNLSNGDKKISTDEKLAKDAKSKIVYTGFIAQDVEKAAKSLNYDFSGVDAPKNKNDFYGLRYADFVVPLVKAVQELNDSLMQSNALLQTKINDLQARLQKIEASLSNQKPTVNSQQSEINSNDEARLEQNVPNPFKSNCIVRYYVPLNAHNAQLIICDANGHILKTILLNEKGNGQISISGSGLTTANYFYSLIIDGKKSDTKQMVLTK